MGSLLTSSPKERPLAVRQCDEACHHFWLISQLCTFTDLATLLRRPFILSLTWRHHYANDFRDIDGRQLWPHANIGALVSRHLAPFYYGICQFQYAGQTVRL